MLTRGGVGILLQIDTEYKRILQPYWKNTILSYQAYPKYEEEFVFLLDIQPSWVDCFDDSIFRQ